MGQLDTVRDAIDAVKSEIEGRYPLTLGAIIPQAIEGDDGWRVDYILFADRHGPMSLLQLCGLEEWIKQRTGFAVLIDTRPAAERIWKASPAAAE